MDLAEPMRATSRSKRNSDQKKQTITEMWERLSPERLGPRDWGEWTRKVEEEGDGLCRMLAN